MAASIEALHIILDCPDTEKWQNPLSSEKYLESTCSFERTQLGIISNTRTMRLSLQTKEINHVKRTLVLALKDEKI